jgi:hypothetical protein
MSPPAFSSAEMVRVFNERVFPALYPARHVRSVRPERMVRRLEGPSVVLYSLSTVPSPRRPETAIPPWAVVSFAADGCLVDIYQRRYAAGREVHGDAPATPPAVLVPEARALIEFFPSDWKLPALARATDTTYMAPLLDGARAQGRSGVSSGRWSYSILRYHPTVRCVVLYASDPGEGFRASKIVGKLYEKTQKSARVWSTLRMLADSGIGSREWQMPTPLAHVPDLNLVLMDYLPGMSVRTLLRTHVHHPLTTQRVGAAARLLAALHQLPGEGLKLRTIDTDRAKILRWAAEAQRVAPRLGERITSLLATMEERFGGLSGPSVGLVHGDFAPGQLRAHRERISIVDCHRVSVGDPAIDVGRFVAAISKYRLRRSDRTAVIELADLFVREYQRRSPDARVTQRARVVKCQELLSYASQGLLRRASGYDDAPDRAAPADLVEEATAGLAEL